MTTIHKEGFRILSIILLIMIIINVFLVWLFHPMAAVETGIIIFFALLFIFFLRFFRKPVRSFQTDNKLVLAPADGKIVVIEETNEEEYFHDKRIQVSVFMSVWNVHINWFPINGLIKYYKYHSGLYLLARHPKSSTENERNTIVIQTENGQEILVRQIAGIVARKISCYCKEGEQARQGEELGFIKFGSRVDIFLPLNAEVKVALGQVSQGKRTVIAQLK